MPFYQRSRSSTYFITKRRLIWYAHKGGRKTQCYRAFSLKLMSRLLSVRVINYSNDLYFDFNTKLKKKKTKHKKQ